jgi:oxygen-dependent protoporphyrinogen oxidase
MQRVVVIGGGITGLAAAYRLNELKRKLGKDLEVILLEASSRLGGIIQTEHRDGFLLERGPDSFISEKPAGLKLINRLGLESQLIETNPPYRRSFIVRNNRLLPVPKGFHLLAPTKLLPFWQSEIFSWPAKLRVTMDLFLRRRGENGATDESLASFVRRRLGHEALERMAQPMVGGIYTADPEHLSLRATFPRFLELERTHGSVIRGMRHQATIAEDGVEQSSGARYGLFLSFGDGMQTLSDELSTQLPAECCELESPVTRLSLNRTNRLWTVEINRGRTIMADRVCLTLPAFVAASLLKESDALLADELTAIPYESTATINLAYDRKSISHPLDGFGFVVPFIEKRSLLACTFSSVKFAGRAPSGSVLLRAFVGGALQPEMFALDEDEMVLLVKADLEELLGIRGEPNFVAVAKWRKSMPQYHVGHLERVDKITKRLRGLPGLALAGSAYRGVGIPDCIKSGEAAAEQLLGM